MSHTPRIAWYTRAPAQPHRKGVEVQSGGHSIRGARDQSPFCLLMAGLCCCLAIAVTASGRPAHGDELCLTGNARGNRNLPVAFTVQPDRAKPLFDGSYADRLSVGFLQNTQVVLTFAEPVRVTRAMVVYYNDPTRTYNAAQRMRLSGALRGAAVAKSDWAPLEADTETLCGADDQLVFGAETDIPFDDVKLIDTLTMEIRKKPEAQQCLIREITVWGVPERLARAASIPLAFLATKNTYSSIRVSWDQIPAGADYVQTRWRKQGDPAWSVACFTKSPGLLLCLRPDADYEVVAEAVGEHLKATPANVASQVVRLPHPLALRKMGDFFGMNFYPGGGGGHQARPDETSNTRRMIALMQAARVRHVRWWAASPGGAELFAEAGMDLFPFATYANVAGYERLARTTGVWLTATQNEPDFANIFAGELVRQFMPTCAAARRFSPRMLVAGPVLGGELVGPGADYLKACYAAGLKDAVDVLDVHPYAKSTTPTARGGILGGPEGVLESIGACREVMCKADAAASPILASECGHSTEAGSGSLIPCTYERQAQWVVRTHLLLAASGLRRLFWYAFQDEGADRNNAEHCFGIVDWYGKPKPAYTAYVTMTRLLENACCEGLEGDLSPPTYGVRCALDKGFVTVLWDSGGTGEVCVRLDSGITGIVSLMGEKLSAPAPVGDAITLKVDESVRYVFSTRPLVTLSARRISPPVEPQVQMSLVPTTVRVQTGHPMQWMVRLASEFDCPVNINLETTHPFGGEPLCAKITLPAMGRAKVTMALKPPIESKPRLVSWDVACRYKPADSRWPGGEFRRALFFEVSK
jgi:hypothetical protein